jgi:hypothetical protein
MPLKLEKTNFYVILGDSIGWKTKADLVKVKLIGRTHCLNSKGLVM